MIPMPIRPALLPALIAPWLLAACQGGPLSGPQSVPLPETMRALGTEVVRRGADAPAGAAPGSCWGEDRSPAHVETVTETVLIPARTDADGQVIRPAELRTETRQRITRDREELLFRTPCPEELTPELVASLQRALAARGLYRGPVSGEMDAATRAAVRAFQRPQGLDSSLLSLTAARQLGLVAFDFGEGDG